AGGAAGWLTDGLSSETRSGSWARVFRGFFVILFMESILPIAAVSCGETGRREQPEPAPHRRRAARTMKKVQPPVPPGGRRRHHEFFGSSGCALYTALVSRANPSAQGCPLCYYYTLPHQGVGRVFPPFSDLRFATRPRGGRTAPSVSTHSRAVGSRLSW